MELEGGIAGTSTWMLWLMGDVSVDECLSVGHSYGLGTMHNDIVPEQQVLQTREFFLPAILY